MISFSENYYYEKILKVATVLNFRNKEIDSDDPHPHVIVHKTKDQVLILGLTTSQIYKRQAFADKINADYATLVYLHPNDTNGLTKESLIDCNTNIYEYTIEDFKRLYNTASISVCGSIDEGQLEQIKNGLTKVG